MNHVFWLIEDQIAGRAGPNRDMWDLTQVADAGFAGILSVNAGDMVNKSMVTQLGMAYANYVLPQNAPPIEGDMESVLTSIPKAISFIEDTLKTGRVLIHCRSGKDRTGIVMAAWLIYKQHLSPKQAVHEVLRVRPIAFTAAGYMPFSMEVLHHLAKNQIR